MRLILNFFKFVIKEIFSFFIKLFLALILIVIVIGIFSASQQVIPPNTKDAYVVWNAEDEFKENPRHFQFFTNSELNLSFYDLLALLNDMKTNKNIKGLIINADNAAFSISQINELGKKITEIKKSGKEVHAFLNNADKHNFLLASYAQNIYMPESRASSVNLYPYYNEDYYTKNLSDKLGIDFNVIHIGDYKSYGEHLKNEHMSPENRSVMERINENLYNTYAQKISSNLNISNEQLKLDMEEGNLVATNSSSLLNKKLISGFSTYANFKKAHEKNNFISIYEYNDFEYKSKVADNHIVLLNLSGAIIENSANTDLASSEFITPDVVISNLEDLENDETVKGIVIRINSPGGSAFASHLIAKKIKEVSKVKPIYVSMSSIAASGGYYIAANANKIFANESTITGSIGVVSLIPNVSKASEKLGINVETIKKGKFSDLYSTASPMTEEKYNKIKESNLEVYDEFLDVVSKGRNIPKDKLEDYAQGKLWLGNEAKEIGLVDKLGGVEETITALAKDLKLTDYSVLTLVNNVDISSIYKKYSHFLKSDAKSLIKESVMENLFLPKSLYNKPITYYVDTFDLKESN